MKRPDGDNFEEFTPAEVVPSEHTDLPSSAPPELCHFRAPTERELEYSQFAQAQHHDVHKKRRLGLKSRVAIMMGAAVFCAGGYVVLHNSNSGETTAFGPAKEDPHYVDDGKIVTLTQNTFSNLPNFMYKIPGMFTHYHADSINFQEVRKSQVPAIREFLVANKLYGIYVVGDSRQKRFEGMGNLIVTSQKPLEYKSWSLSGSSLKQTATRTADYGGNVVDAWQEDRAVEAVKLRYTKDGKEGSYWVVNTHLAGGGPVQRRQFAEVTNISYSLTKGSTPVMLAGDFNMGDNAFIPDMSDAGFWSPKYRHNQMPTSHNTSPEAEPYIDHQAVHYAGKLSTLRVRVYETPPEDADHNLVVGRAYVGNPGRKSPVEDVRSNDQLLTKGLQAPAKAAEVIVAGLSPDSASASTGKK
jgi:hypothetical protein